MEFIKCASFLVVVLGALIVNHPVFSTKAYVHPIASELKHHLQLLPGDPSEAIHALDQAVKAVDSNPGEKSKLTEFLEKYIRPAVKKMMSGNGYMIVSGCLDIITGISKTYGGPYGVVVSEISSFVSSLFTMMNKKGTESPTESVLDSAMRKYRERTFVMQAEGAKREFAESTAFIEVLKKSKNITNTKLAILAANVPIYRFSALLGALEYYVSQGAVAQEIREANKTIDFVLLYSQLVVMRETLLTDLFILYKKPGTADDIADAIANAIRVNRKFAKEHLRFLYEIGPEHAIIASMFYPVRHTYVTQSIWSYKNFFGVPDPPNHIPAGLYIFQNVYWNRHSICAKWYSVSSIFRSCKDAKEGNIRVIPLANGYYKLQNKNKKNLYVTDSSEGWVWGTSDDDPGDQGYINFIPLRTGNYLLSTKKWPDYFMYMESSANGYIRSYQGNPGPQGYWNLVK